MIIPTVVPFLDPTIIAVFFQQPFYNFGCVKWARAEFYLRSILCKFTSLNFGLAFVVLNKVYWIPSYLFHMSCFEDKIC